MKLACARGTLVQAAVCLTLVFLTVQFASAKENLPEAVQISAPDGLSTNIYSHPEKKSDLLGIALQGDILEVRGVQGEFYEIRLSVDKKVSGFVLRDHTSPYEDTDKKSVLTPTVIAIGAVIALIALAAGFLVFRARKTHETAQQVASIPASIKRGEELFRAGEYGEAIREFRSYISLQGGEVRNPDVYRRLTVCYQNTNEIREAALAWEKMRSLGGLKNLDDYSLGVELMSALGREAEAANIYEQLLQHENDEDKRCEIHKKLLDIYRRLKDGKKVVQHAMKLRTLGTTDPNILPDTIHYLIAEGQTDVAIESNSRELVVEICTEFLEDKAQTPEAGRIYLKALEYDRTDQRLHRMLANIYNESGDVKRAVSELTILHQLDKDQSEVYLEEAARIYLEKNRISTAIAEGNPLIIKKIAQLYLARSEVNPEAVAIYEKVLEFQPKAVGINRMLSTVYLTRGELDKYMSKLRLLYEIDGSNHDYLSDLAKCIIDNDMIDETLKEGNRDLNAKIVKQLIKQGKATDTAVSLLEKLIRVEPDNVTVRAALAKAYERRSEKEKCFDHVLHILRIRPDDEEFSGMAASLAAELNRLHDLPKKGHPRVLVSAAEEIITRNMTDSFARQILELACEHDPSEFRFSSYLGNLKSATAVPLPQLEAASEPKNEDKPEIRPEVKPAIKPEPRKKASPEISSKKVADRKIEPTPPPRPPAARPKPKQPPQKVKSPQKTEEIRIEKIHDAKDVTAKVRSAKTPDRKEQIGPPDEKPVIRTETPRSAPTVVPDPLQKKEEKPAGPPQQAIRFTDEVLTEERAVTTFVSGHASGRTGNEFAREELLLPTAGGLAYKEMEALVQDGWGSIHVGMEVNTGRPVLIRLFRKGIMEPLAMKEFVAQVSETSYNAVHDNILPLEEVVRGLGGAHALVHPFFSRTLEGVMRDKRRPDLPIRLDMIQKVLNALVFAHNYTGMDGTPRKTYHLQLQSNLVFVSNDYKRLQIAGFGHSQIYRNILRPKQPRWQDPGMNPQFMPPEFFRSKANIKEKAADIYSLGILIYYMATGEYPFEGPAFDDYKFQHIRIFAAPPRLIDPTIPDWLEPIILGCLEKDADKRWDSVKEIANAFAKGLSHQT
ncbi:protein kinase domain-containing protein [Desulfomonile tiedjei]|uniref:Protein kinase family protein n=1 Tax=Desulfomonile tiedjei (strain ATCC 49306 / DSM 6799 / DCB-1) TaxID=706587 RepID=I4BZT6_DESTA|nr:tetratricopeptide repeat protein [Desulfomonile tiedjei]AFM22827.1 protein kinase family protein [Desulfomonile tiedjei DSM 6799]